LVQKKIEDDEFYKDPLLFKKSLFIFEQAVHSFGNFNDFSTYLFTLEKLQLGLVHSIITRSTKPPIEESQKDLIEMNFESINSFLTSIFCGPVETLRLNGILLKILDNILTFISNSPKDNFVAVKVTKLIETLFTIKAINMNPSYHSNKIYSNDNESLFLRMHLALFDVIKLRIGKNDFTFISLLFPLFIQKFEIFQAKMVKFKFYDNVHSIELKIISKILSYLTLHLSENFNDLGPQYFLCAQIFLNKVKKNSIKENTHNLPQIVIDFYSNFKDLVLATFSKKAQEKTFVNPCLFRAIHLLSKNIKLLVNIILKNKDAPSSVWKELKFVISLFLEIECSSLMTKVLFTNQGLQLSCVLSEKDLKDMTKMSKAHLLLIHLEMTSLLNVGVDSSFGALASQYFQSILQFLLLPLAKSDNSSSANDVVMKAYFPKIAISEEKLDDNNVQKEELNDLSGFCENGIFQPSLFFRFFDKDLVSQAEQKFFDLMIKYEAEGISEQKMKELLDSADTQLVLLRGLVFIQKDYTSK
jgi:hypothetical protein